MPKFEIPNTPEIRNLNEYRAVLNKEYGLANKDRFVVVLNKNLDRTLERDLVYLCDTAEFPGRTFATGNDIRYYGPSFKIPVISTYTPVNISFVVRDYMSERYFFDKWMETINPKSTYDFNYRTDYETMVDIFQLNEFGSKDKPAKATYKVTLRHAWPLSFDSMPLSWGEDSFHKVTVTFTYTDWFNNEEYAKGKLDANFFQLVDGANIRR